jgi:hypothetical protein
MLSALGYTTYCVGGRDGMEISPPVTPRLLQSCEWNSLSVVMNERMHDRTIKLRKISTKLLLG